MTDETSLQRELPVPPFLSEEAQAVLSMPIDMSAVDRPAPASTAEWRERIAETEDLIGPMILDRVAQSPVTVTPGTIGGVDIRDVRPDDSIALREGKVLINLHGGGYTMFGGDLCVMESSGMAAAGFRVVAVNYRMPPEHPFPAAVEDGLAVYRTLLEDYAPENIAFFGSSAGGSLTAAVILAARDEGLPLPAAAVMHTPWSDLAKIGDSYYTNEGVDPMLPSYAMLGPSAELYAAGEGLEHPLVSPVYGDYSKGFPPSLLSTGTRDMLLSCTVRLHRQLRKAGIEADLHIFDGLWHGFALLVPVEGRELDNETIAFLERHLGGE